MYRENQSNMSSQSFPIAHMEIDVGGDYQNISYDDTKQGSEREKRENWKIKEWGKGIDSLYWKRTWRFDIVTKQDEDYSYIWEKNVMAFRVWPGVGVLPPKKLLQVQ